MYNCTASNDMLVVDVMGLARKVPIKKLKNNTFGEFADIMHNMIYEITNNNCPILIRCCV